MDVGHIAAGCPDCCKHFQATRDGARLRHGRVADDVTVALADEHRNLRKGCDVSVRQRAARARKKSAGLELDDASHSRRVLERCFSWE